MYSNVHVLPCSSQNSKVIILWAKIDQPACAAAGGVVVVTMATAETNKPKLKHVTSLAEVITLTSGKQGSFVF